MDNQLSEFPALLLALGVVWVWFILVLRKRGWRL